MGSNYLIKLLSQIFTQMVIVSFTPESLRNQPLLIPGFDIQVNDNLKDFPFSPFQWAFLLSAQCYDLFLLSAQCYDYHIQFENALFYLMQVRDAKIKGSFSPVLAWIIRNANTRGKNMRTEERTLGLKSNTRDRSEITGHLGKKTASCVSDLLTMAPGDLTCEDKGTECHN